MRNLVAGLICLAAISSASAEGSSRGHGMGGPFAPFEAIVAQYNASGEPFRIEGHCQSSCTMFLGIRNVCVERSAQLLFHAGRERGVVTAAATARMTRMYNARLLQYVTAHHFMDTLELHAIPGSELISRFGYRACPRR